MYIKAYLQLVASLFLSNGLSLKRPQQSWVNAVRKTCESSGTTSCFIFPAFNQGMFLIMKSYQTKALDRHQDMFFLLCSWLLSIGSVCLFLLQRGTWQRCNQSMISSAFCYDSFFLSQVIQDHTPISIKRFWFVQMIFKYFNNVLCLKAPISHLYSICFKVLLFKVLLWNRISGLLLEIYNMASERQPLFGKTAPTQFIWFG